MPHTRQRRRPITLLLTVMLVASLLPVTQAAADTQVYGPSGPTWNQPGTWEAWGLTEFNEVWICDKIDQGMPSYTLPPPPMNYRWRLLVIKAGAGAQENALFFDPVVGESYLNPSTGDVSHVIRCRIEEPVVLQGLTASKTATATYQRTVEWDIEKSVTPGSLELFIGDEAEVAWTVSVIRSDVESDFLVTGEITIRNPNAVPIDFSVADVLDDGTPGIVDCDPATPGAQAFGTAPPAVDDVPGTAICTYTAEPAGRTAMLNTATVSVMDMPDVEALAPLVWEETVVGEESITVSDTNGMQWPATESTSWTYLDLLACEADQGRNVNVATILETGAEASAVVEVDCYGLDVSKDSQTYLERTWTWDIDKVGSAEALSLAPGQIYTVDYEVSVSATSVDHDFRVEGDILVRNPAPTRSAIVNSVTDLVSDGIVAEVACTLGGAPVTFPVTLGPGEHLDCAYAALLPDASTRMNEATAVLQNQLFDVAGAPVPTGTTSFVGTAPVSFDAAMVTQIDRCVEVDDSLAGFLGTVCASMSPFQQSFTYSLPIGPFDECLTVEIPNIARFVTGDRELTGEAEWLIVVETPCPICTLTQGYWKTHSEFGPAPYDDTWAELPMGASTPFYLSGKTYYEVLRTPPVGGNPYYQLAHQFIAAQLNLLNGATLDLDTVGAYIAAENWLSTALPGNRLSRAETALVRGWAETLDIYNNAYHCDEDGFSV